MFTYRKSATVLSILSFVFMGFIFSAACSNQNQKKVNTEFLKQTDDIDKNVSEMNLDEFVEYDPETVWQSWFSAGSKIKALSDIPEIDDPVILVNGNPIIKRRIESQQILENISSDVPLKNTVINVVRTTVCQLEADRLGVQPIQEDIDVYMESIKSAFSEDDVDGMEQILGYIEGLGITVEEYLETTEDIAYKMFQRGALWQSVESQKKYKNRDAYIDSLVMKAKIEILDHEIKELFDFE